MKLKNVLIIVKDIKRSIEFYEKYFGLRVKSIQEGNVILTEGLVLQDEKIWTKYVIKDIASYNNHSLIYFEEQDMEALIEKLASEESIKLLPLEESKFFVSKKDQMVNYYNEKGCIRFYDPDGNLIEVRKGDIYGNLVL